MVGAREIRRNLLLVRVHLLEKESVELSRAFES